MTSLVSRNLQLPNLQASPMTSAELLMEFERVFGIKIPDEETAGISTVGDAIAKVAEKLG